MGLPDFDVVNWMLSNIGHDFQSRLAMTCTVFLLPGVWGYVGGYRIVIMGEGDVISRSDPRRAKLFVL